MKLLTLIGTGVVAGYCYKKLKDKKKNSKNNNYHYMKGDTKSS